MTVSTFSGVVVSRKTREDGTFTAIIPDKSGERVGIVAEEFDQSFDVEIADEIPEEIPDHPPAFVETNKPVDLDGHFREVLIEDPRFDPEQEGISSASLKVPVAQSISADGSQVVTRYLLPEGVEPGRLTTVLRDSEGNEQRYATDVYELVRAGIDQETLGSGEKAEFFFEYDFGAGEERDIWVTVSTVGPIEYGRNSQRQPLRVDEDGFARVAGRVRALQGSPTGIPFQINAMMERQ